MTAFIHLVINVFLAFTALFAAYLLLGNLWHRILSPFPAPDPASFPRAGDRFFCRTEGVVMDVHRVEDGMAFGQAVLEPGAAGPPMHTHQGFPETFTPIAGELHVQLADRVVKLRAGETLTVAAGVPHKPFNPTSERVVLGGAAAMFPLSFAASLVQLYRFMDERGTKPLTMMLQMSVMDAIADTQLAAVPRGMAPIMRAVLGPAARLLGYRNYYPEWALHESPTMAPHETRRALRSAN